MSGNTSKFCRWLAVFCLGLCVTVSGFGAGALLTSAPALADSDPGARKRASRRVTPTKRRGTKKVESYWDADFTIALTSDYVFRGFSNNNERVTPQAEFALNFVNGAHFSIWTSAVREEYFDAKAEIEYDIGYVYDVNNKIDIDYGLKYYYYHGSDTDDGYAELYVTFMHQLHPSHGAHLNVSYANEYYDETDEFYYVSAKYLYEWKTLDVWVSAGWNYFENPDGYLKYVYGSDAIDQYRSDRNAVDMNNMPVPLTGTSLLISQDNDDSYVDFSAGVSYQFNEFLTLALELTDTDLQDRICGDRCGDQAILSIFWQF